MNNPLPLKIHLIFIIIAIFNEIKISNKMIQLFVNNIFIINSY